jgi:hypothetical protein
MITKKRSLFFQFAFAAMIDVKAINGVGVHERVSDNEIEN